MLASRCKSISRASALLGSHHSSTPAVMSFFVFATSKCSNRKITNLSQNCYGNSYFSIKECIKYFSFFINDNNYGCCIISDILTVFMFIYMAPPHIPGECNKLPQTLPSLVFGMFRILPTLHTLSFTNKSTNKRSVATLQLKKIGEKICYRVPTTLIEVDVPLIEVDHISPRILRLKTTKQETTIHAMLYH